MNRFNQPKPFHKTLAVESSGRVPKKWNVYDVADAQPEKNWNESFNNSRAFERSYG